MPIRLSRYMLPDVPRKEAARRHLNSSYASIEDLWDRHLDGLIVTGREPLTAKPDGRTLLGELHQSGWTGPRQYPLDGLVVPGGARRHSSSGRHRRVKGMTSSSASSSVRACTDHPLTAGTPLALQASAFALERRTRRAFDQLRIPRAHAGSGCGRRHLHQATENPLCLFPGSSRV